MSSGRRLPVFVLSVVLIIGGVLAAAVLLQRDLLQSEHRRNEAELMRHAETGRLLLSRLASDWSLAALDGVADALGAAARARVTIVAADGRVLGDSELDLAGVEAVENHANRPEVIQALDEGWGAAVRHSPTLGVRMVYVAAIIPSRDTPPQMGPVVVRLARPLSAVDGAVAELRLLLVLAGLVGAVAVLLAAYLVAQHRARTLRILVGHTRTVAEESGTWSSVPSTRDEIGMVASSFNNMRHELADLVEALAQERDRFGAVLEGMDAALLVVDADGRITMANSRARSLFATTPIEGRTLLEVLRAPAIEWLMRTVRETGTTREEFDLPGPERRRVVARASAQRATGGAVLLISDVTEVRRLESIRRDFVANASHELRTPVSVIRATAETLSGVIHDDPERADKFIRALLRNTDRLSRIIDDMLDLSRLESDRYPLDMRPMELAPVVDQAVEAIQARAEQKRMRLSTELEPELVVRADVTATEHVLINLLDNAIKYTPEDGNIIVRGRRQADRVRVEVEDDGPGIPERFRARLFERFYRLDEGRSRDVGGTGLGLAVVKHLTGAMGGSLGITPAPSGGSVFWFDLAVAELAPGDPDEPG